jgi:hypothetical protein
MIEVDLGCEVVGGVESVNGKKGVVVLDGTEIELIGNGGVTVTQAIADLDANKVTDVTAGTNITIDKTVPNIPVFNVPSITTATQTALDGKVSNTTVGEPTGSDSLINAVSLTQAEFDAGTPVATTLYLITDA